MRHIALLAALAVTSFAQALPSLRVTDDDTVIRKSCRIVIPPGTVIDDAGNDGAIRIVGRDLTVVFDEGSLLRGAGPDDEPDRFTGIGILAEDAEGLTLRGLRVEGYRVGLEVRRSARMVIEDSVFENLFRQRLRSTPDAEDGADWLRPHHNDSGEWKRNYGAAVVLESCRQAALLRLRVRRSQNGIILDRVSDSRVYDNDASFLSGWGLALWRSCGNVITRNAFDFCIRGYSHGVYNRGQDSAGILLFEQSSGNVIAENSATHGGDGIFGFAGSEALEQQARAGCNDNLLLENDFSYAAAHGIELTFSFGNVFRGNRLVGNAICGVWGGYSQETLVCDNLFESNGDRGYGLERGGVNIEHGYANRIIHNTFRHNRCGVHLWWDPDEGLMSKPWARANHKGCLRNVVVANSFEGDTVAIHLRAAKETLIGGNVFEAVGKEIEIDAESSRLRAEGPELPSAPSIEVLGKTRPVGARQELAGRENIVMTPWGPWDHHSPLARPIDLRGGEHVYEIHGLEAPLSVSGATGVEADLDQDASPPRLAVRASKAGVYPYELEIRSPGGALGVSGTLLSATWKVTLFPYTGDPREDADAWRRQSRSEKAATVELDHLDLPFAGAGPSDLKLELGGDRLPRDHFGTIARTSIALGAGTWRVRTLSDDGVRVTVDGNRIIDNWTWHGPTRDEGRFTLDAPRSVAIVVEHFELDGYAVLSLELSREAP
jgi:parallel beta-helix repeat protein